MGKRGPKPKPDKLPTGEVEAPPCPDWLDGLGKAEWKKISVRMIERRTITPDHQQILAVVCDSMSAFRRNVKRLQEEGEVIETSNGNLVQHPSVGIRNRAWEQVVKGLAHLGLTPATRSDVEALANEDDGLGAYT